MGKDLITEEEFIDLFNQLMEQELEPITLVLLTCHGHAVYDRVVKRMTALIQGGGRGQLWKAGRPLMEYLFS